MLEQWDNQISTLINSYGYAGGINLILWIIAIGTMYIAGIIFVHRARVKGMINSQVWLYTSFGLFFFLMGLVRISFLLSYQSEFESNYHLLLSVGYAFGAISLLPIVITIERFMVTKSRKIFSILGIILCIISLYFVIFPEDSPLSRTIQDIGMPFLALSFLLLYLWVIIHSAGDVRHKAIMTLLGIVVLVVGIILDSENLVLENVPLGPPIIIIMNLSPIVFWLGVVIVTSSQKMD